jgi:RHS repeat-associated protein
VTGARNESYGYDAAGNRNTGGATPGPANRQVSDGTYNYTYDNEGNVLTRTRISDGQLTSFTWDFRNRLAEATVQGGGQPPLDLRFTYDVNDNLIGRSVTVNGVLQGKTWTVYDGGNPYADFNASGVLTARYLASGGLDTLMARMDNAGNVVWYLGDLLGSVRQVVTTAGAVLDQLAYDSFGQIVSESNAAGGDRFKYTGREWDANLGLYYYRARWYAPTAGRFLSEDPAGFGAGDANLYRYVGNFPTDATDPTGLQPAPIVLPLPQRGNPAAEAARRRNAAKDLEAEFAKLGDDKRIREAGRAALKVGVPRDLILAIIREDRTGSPRERANEIVADLRAATRLVDPPPGARGSRGRVPSAAIAGARDLRELSQKVKRYNRIGWVAVLAQSLEKEDLKRVHLACRQAASPRDV